MTFNETIIRSWIENPLNFVFQCFEDARTANGGNLPVHDKDKEWGVRNRLLDAFRDMSMINKIPLLTKDKIKKGELRHNTLVRYRGMVQDMYDTEFYIGMYTRLHIPTGERMQATSKYTEGFADTKDMKAIYDGPESRTCERQPIYCVPLPGESEWFRYASDQPDFAQNDTNSMPPGRFKRRLSQSQSDEETTIFIDSSESDPCGKTKRQALGMNDENRGKEDVKFDMNFPFESDSELPCVIKVYDDTSEDSLKLNDAVEFIGILSLDMPIQAEESMITPLQPFNTGNNSEPMDEEELLAHNPPASLIPRVHAITYRKIEAFNNLHTNGAFHSFNRHEENSSAMLQNLSVALMAPPLSLSVLRIREDLRSHISILLGDALAAEYLLLNMVSRVHSRINDAVIGALPINIVNVARGSTLCERLPAFLATVLPLTHKIALTVDLLNARSFSPAKDYMTNRLKTGQLQLAAGTSLVIDETELNAGQLTAIGVSNVQALQTLCKHQKVAYDFQFYSTSFDADVSVIILSTAKSLIAGECQINLSSTEASIGPTTLSDELVQKFRLYLAGLRHLDVTIDQAVSSLAEQHFVQARAQDALINGDDLHRWLTMAKLMAISRGEVEVSPSVWHSVLALDITRKQRILPRPSNPGSVSADRMKSPSSVADLQH